MSAATALALTGVVWLVGALLASEVASLTFRSTIHTHAVRLAWTGLALGLLCLMVAPWLAVAS